MAKVTAWEVIGRGMRAYKATENGDPNRVEAVWDAQPRAVRAAVGRRVADSMGGEWCNRHGDAFNRFLAYVETLVEADRATMTPRVSA